MKPFLTRVVGEHFAIGLTLSLGVIWALSRGLNLAQIATIGSVALAVGLLIDIPTSRLADRWERRFLLTAANCLQAGSLLVVFFANSFSLFLLAAILMALGFACSSGAEEAYLYEIAAAAKSNYRRLLSRVQIYDEVATIGGLLAASVLVKLIDLRWLFLLAALSMAVAALVSWRLLDDTPSLAAKAGRRLPRWRDFGLYAPFIPMFIVGAIYYEGGAVLWQPQLLAVGATVSQVSLIYVLLKLASLAGAYLGRHRRWPLRGEIVFLGFALTLAIIFIGSASLMICVTALVVYSGLENIYRLASSEYLQELAPVNQRASFLSVAGFTRQGYGIIINPILGFLAIGGVSTALLLLVILQIVATVGFWRLKIKKLPSGRPAVLSG